MYASFWENVVSFWRLCSQTPTGELPLDPAGGLPSFRPPHCPPLKNIQWAPMMMEVVGSLVGHCCLTTLGKLLAPLSSNGIIWCRRENGEGSSRLRLPSITLGEICSMLAQDGVAELWEADACLGLTYLTFYECILHLHCRWCFTSWQPYFSKCCKHLWAHVNE